MADTFSVVRGAGFITLHPAGVVSALLVVATAILLFGGVWIWLSHLASGEQATATTGSPTTFPNDRPSAAQSPRGREVGIADEVSGDREMSLTS